MTRRSAALIVAIAVGTLSAKSVRAATLEFTRSSRPVTALEAAGGAPAGGMVHDFYVTSDADLLMLGPEINASVYKHPYNSNHEAPDPELVAEFPAVGASSFLRMPSSTVVLGGGFTVTGSAWGDLSNDGPQANFLFGRLTTTQAGTFAGNFYVRGADLPIVVPFSLSLPGPGESLVGGGGGMSMTEMQSVFAEEAKGPEVVPPPIDTSLQFEQELEQRLQGFVSLIAPPKSTDFRAALERKYGRRSRFTHLGSIGATSIPEPSAWVVLITSATIGSAQARRRQIHVSCA